MTAPTAATRALVWDRDSGTCLGCGLVITPGAWWSLQHRVARGVGGGNGPEQLVVLCGSATSKGCHRTCEDRDPEMHRRGLWLRSTEDPLLVPVILYSPFDPDGATRWLTREGTYSLTPPGEAA